MPSNYEAAGKIRYRSSLFAPRGRFWTIWPELTHHGVYITAGNTGGQAGKTAIVKHVFGGVMD